MLSFTTNHKTTNRQASFRCAQASRDHERWGETPSSPNFYPIGEGSTESPPMITGTDYQRAVRVRFSQSRNCAALQSSPARRWYPSVSG